MKVICIKQFNNPKEGDHPEIGDIDIVIKTTTGFEYGYPLFYYRQLKRFPDMLMAVECFAILSNIDEMELIKETAVLVT